jgi:50S ribosomal protein L16 3-hydroxylase
MSSGLALLGGLSPRAFLRRHWQKRPLLVRGAIPGFRDPITPARLLALATCATAESRLVLERGGRHPWELVPGPLDRARLSSLGPTHWTVLVQNADAHAAGIAALIDRFSFLPRWRVDDVMVSLAAPLGSVGPHVDSYDVFLLQGLGRRRWRIARRFDERHRPGLDLRVLRGFASEQEWVLEPGDMLYLPPGVAHHGVALEECLTYSIGFRAPAAFDLAAGFLQRTVSAIDRDLRYEDPDLVPAREPGEITPVALARMRTLVARAAAVDGRAFARFAGAHLTGSGEEARTRPRRVSRRSLERALRAGAYLVRAPRARLAFIRRGASALLFANGREWVLRPVLAPLAAALTAPGTPPPRIVRSMLRRPGCAELLADLVSAGVFRVRRGPSARPAAAVPQERASVAAPPGRRGNRRASGSRSRARRR